MGALAVGFAATLWGLDGIVLTPGLYSLNVQFVVFILHAFPFILMNTFLFREYRKLSLFNREDYLYLFLVALSGGILGTLFMVKALFLVNFTKLSAIVLIQKLQPVFAVMLAALILKEKITGKFLHWAAVALICSYFLTFGWDLPVTGSNNAFFTASVYSLLAALAFGGSTVFSKKILIRYSFSTATFYRFGFTAIIMIPVVTFVNGWISAGNITQKELLYIVIIGLTTGSGAIFLYYWGLKKINAIVATFCELLFPASAVVFDYLVNGTTLSPVHWIAAFILIFSVIMISRGTDGKKRAG